MKNLFSFGEQVEFNMFPGGEEQRLAHHKYDINGFPLLKTASLYGANGAGKSNLINALGLLQQMILKEKVPGSFSYKRFKLSDTRTKDSQILAIEFFQNEMPFYYALEISEGIIKTEELYESGLGKADDRLIYERKTDDEKKTSIQFLEEFEKDTEGSVLKKVIAKNLSKPGKPLLKLLAELDNPLLEDIKTALSWFEDSLLLISPNTKPIALAHTLDINKDFKEYAEEILCSFHTGIKSLKSEKMTLEEYFGEDNLEEVDEMIKKIEDSPRLRLRRPHHRIGDEVIFVKENEEYFAKQLKLEHMGKDGVKASFDLDEESDGTIRLLDFIPVFKYVVSRNKVVIIDEIERSIHPLLIKELVRKFSNDDKSKGQLIFTTHESNLLDLEIFRKDEIWFVEKDKNGSTNLYSLNDFKEHNITDVRKGYFNGRYGSIPFLGNLKDLNWHKYDTKK